MSHRALVILGVIPRKRESSNPGGRNQRNTRHARTCSGHPIGQSDEFERRSCRES
jgi:hypothetical protein